MATTEAPTTAPAIWSRNKDRYGRPSTTLYTAGLGTIAVLVTLSKTYEAEYGDRYMVTDLRRSATANYSNPDVTTTWYFAKRADAKAFAETLLAS